MTPFKIIFKICRLVCMHIFEKNWASKKKAQKSQYLRNSIIRRVKATNRPRDGTGDNAIYKFFPIMVKYD